MIDHKFTNNNSYKEIRDTNAIAGGASSAWASRNLFPSLADTVGCRDCGAAPSRPAYRSRTGLALPRRARVTRTARVPRETRPSLYRIPGPAAAGAKDLDGVGSTYVAWTASTRAIFFNIFSNMMECGRIPFKTLLDYIEIKEDRKKLRSF